MLVSINAPKNLLLKLVAGLFTQETILATDIFVLFSNSIFALYYRRKRSEKEGCILHLKRVGKCTSWNIAGTIKTRAQLLNS